MSILLINDLYKKYSRHGKEIIAVDRISLDVEPGTVLGLLGPNGAGKTTLIKCCLGLIAPTSGQISIAGFDIDRQRKQALHSIGAVLEGSRNIYWYLTPLENLVLFANLVGISPLKARKSALNLLEHFGLLERANTNVGELSRGMQQKVAICAALIRNPQLLLLDEPTLGLDIETSTHLRSLLINLARDEKRTIIVSSHQMDLIEAICEQVVIIQHGKIVAQEPVTRLLELFATRTYRFRTEQPLSMHVIQCIEGRFPMAQIQTDDISTVVEITFDCGEQLYEVMQIFSNSGCLLRSLEHHTPNLEAVFLRVIQKELS
jgi:ABC-2 type transport system ATP-binding protein